MSTVLLVSYLLVAGSPSTQLELGRDYLVFEKIAHPGKESITCIALSPDESILAAGLIWRKTRRCAIRIWDIDTQRVLADLEGNGHAILDLAFSLDSQRLASICGDKRLAIWKLPVGRVKRMQKPKLAWQMIQNRVRKDAISGCGFFVSFSPDGRLIAASSSSLSEGFWPPDPNQSDVVKLWSIDGTLQRTFAHRWRISDFAFSPDGKSLAIAVCAVPRDKDFAIRLWNIESGEIESTIIPKDFNERDPDHLHETWHSSLAFSPDGKSLAVGGIDGYLVIWDVAANKPQRRLKGHIRDVSSVDYSEDGALFVSAGHTLRGTLRLWDLHTGRELWKMPRSEHFFHDVQFSRHTKYLAYHNLREIRLIKMPHLLRKIHWEQTETTDVSKDH